MPESVIAATKGARRRRGEALRAAILAATVAELIESGYGALTIEGVAERARTGKTSLYRRWPTKQALVLAALDDLMPDPDGFPHSSDLRVDLLALLNHMRESLAGQAGPAMSAVLGELHREPDFFMLVRERLLQPRLRHVQSLFGAVLSDDPGLRAQLARLGPAMVVHHYLTYGTPPGRPELEQLVDAVILPLVGDDYIGTHGAMSRRDRTCLEVGASGDADAGLDECGD